MDRVERAAEDAEAPGDGRRRAEGRARVDDPVRGRHRPSHASRLPLELGRADPHEVAGLDARAAQLGVDAEPREVALEPLGGLLDVEVGLGGDPLDPRAADPEDPVLERLDRRSRRPSPRCDGRRRPPAPAARPAPRRRAGGRRRAARNASSPSPVDAEMATTVRPSASRARRKAGQASCAAGRSSLLKATSIGFSRSAGSCARELLADDLVVPLGIARRAVDDVDEDARPLDVAQEGVAEAGAGAGALDEARDVGDRRPALVLVAEVHDARGSARGS